MKKIILVLLVLLSMFDDKIRVIAVDPDVVFSMSCDRDVIYKNEEVSLSLCAKALHEVNISTFKLSIKFDSEKLIFKELSAFSPVGDSEIKYNLNESMLDVIFLTEDDGINLQTDQELKLIEFDFKALKTSNEKLLIDSEVDGVGNFDEKYLYTSTVNDIYINVSSAPKFDCRLSALEPSEGLLSPDFSPDIFDYTLEVPADCSEIDFDTVTCDENASVKISKHRLKKPGEETKIKISAKSPDKKNKLVYHVLVKRDPKEIEKDTKVENKNSNKNSSKNKKSKDKTNAKQSGKNKEVKNGHPQKSLDKKLSQAKGTEEITNQQAANEQTLDIDSSDNIPTLILRENGFSFIIFCIVIAFTFLCLFFIWKRKK